MAVTRRDPATGLQLPGVGARDRGTPVTTSTGLTTPGVTRPTPRPTMPTAQRREAAPASIQQPGVGAKEPAARQDAAALSQVAPLSAFSSATTPAMTAPPLSGNMVAQLRAQSLPQVQDPTGIGAGGRPNQENATAALVTNTFQSLMGRPPSAAELQAWTVGLMVPDPQTGQTRSVASMVDQILSFPEAQARLTEPSAGTPGVEVPFQIPQNVWASLVQGITQPAQVQAPEPSALEGQLTETLASLLQGGPQLSDSELSRMLTSAREPLDILNRAQQEQAMSDLAARGLLGGGAEGQALLEIQEALAPAFAAGGRDIAQAIQDRQLQQFTTGVQQAGQLAQTQQQTGSQQAIAQAQLQAGQTQAAMDMIGMLTGANQDQARLMLQSIQSAADIGNAEARFLLDTINSMVNFQGQTTGLALQALDQNMAWNQFLASMGLDRARFLQDAQAGQLDAWAPVLQQFAQLLQQSQLGFAAGTAPVPQ